MMVFISNGKKLHISAYSGHLHVLTTFLLKERGTHHKRLPISTFHTLVLSPIENQMRQAYAHAHIAKPWRQTIPHREQQVPKNKETSD